MTVIGVIVALIVAVAAAAAGYFIGYNNRKKTAEAQIGSAEAEATRLVNEAIKTADQKRKEAVLEAKDEAFRLKAEVDAQKAEADKEIKQRRAEISRQENRIDQKETALDRKTEALEKKEEELKKRAADAEERLAEIDALRTKEMERLETLAGLSQEDAREVLLHKVDEELTHEKAVRVAAYETDLKENCDGIARNLIGQAISDKNRQTAFQNLANHLPVVPVVHHLRFERRDPFLNPPVRSKDINCVETNPLSIFIGQGLFIQPPEFRRVSDGRHEIGGNSLKPHLSSN